MIISWAFSFCASLSIKVSIHFPPNIFVPHVNLFPFQLLLFYHVSPTVTTKTPGILRFQSMFVFMQFVQFVFLFLCFFVKFTKFSHHVHNLFIIGWYTLNTVKEEIRLPDNKAYKINFFIIAQAPKGVWALLILWGFCMSPAEAFALFGCSAI